MHIKFHLENPEGLDHCGHRGSWEDNIKRNRRGIEYGNVE